MWLEAKWTMSGMFEHWLLWLSTLIFVGLVSLFQLFDCKSMSSEIQPVLEVRNQGKPIIWLPHSVDIERPIDIELVKR